MGYITDTPGSGLQQLGARFYWPEIGRFVSQDPIGDGMNWYAYAKNNPVVFIDPEGLCPPNDKYYGVDKRAFDWFHPEKRKGDKDLNADESRDLGKEWERAGKPRPDNKGKWRERRRQHPRNQFMFQPEVVVDVVATVGVGYMIYRAVRMLPSLAPPLWWTLPANVAIP